MVLRPKTRKSRSLPGLQMTDRSPSSTLPKTIKPRSSRNAGRGFLPSRKSETRRTAEDQDQRQRGGKTDRHQPEGEGGAEARGDDAEQQGRQNSRQGSQQRYEAQRTGAVLGHQIGRH